MKTADLLTIAAGAVLAFVAFQFLKSKSAMAAPGGIVPASNTAAIWTQELNIVNDGGWRYFDDGTAIAPNGDYFHKGELIWKASQ